MTREKSAGSGNLCRLFAPQREEVGNISQPTCPFGHGISNPDFSFGDFQTYLKAQNRSNARQIMYYARKYHKVLETGDSSIIGAVVITSPSGRRDVLEALTVRSKYYGLYDRLKAIISKYKLHWGNAAQDNLRYFTKYLQGNSNFEMMIAC